MREQRLPAGRSRARPERAAEITGRLAALGITVPIAGNDGNVHAEVALMVSVDALQRDGRYARTLRQRLVRLCADRARVCLLPVCRSGTLATDGEWRDFRDRLAALFPPGAEPPALRVHSHQLPLAELAGLARDSAPFSSCYVYCDSLQMQSHVDERVQARTESNWRALWRDGLMPAYGGFVRSACPLLADEAATAVLPVTGLSVPQRSAWLVLCMDLAALADQRGRLDPADLEAVIADAVPLADALLDQVRPATAAQRRDAADNRRLALLVGGIGDLVAMRARDPADLDCLRELHAEMLALRDAVNLASAREARRSGPLPALSLPLHEWFDGHHQVRWRQHFEAARRRVAVRHRNLLAMSPYAVLPSKFACDPAYADLLPLLAFADAWAFSGPPDFGHWNLSQFKQFHTRARAIIQASQAITRIAAGA